MKEKQYVDYYKNEKFLFRIGQVRYRKAHHPLSSHTHENCIELVFMNKGCQTYQVEQKFYTVYGQEVFLTFPGEEHSTGGKPEEKAGFYYLILNLDRLIREGGGCVPEEKDRFLKNWGKNIGRIQKSKLWYGEACFQLWSLCLGEDPFKHTKIRNILSLLLTDVMEQGKKMNQKSSLEIEKVLDYIKKNIKENLSIEDLAENIPISVSRFKALFMTKVGIPPREYIVREKLKCCKKELLGSRKSITELAYEYGFSSSQYFSTVFKRYCMVSPSDYRKGGSENDEP